MSVHLVLDGYLLSTKNKKYAVIFPDLMMLGKTLGNGYNHY